MLVSWNAFPGMIYCFTFSPHMFLGICDWFILQSNCNIIWLLLIKILVDQYLLFLEHSLCVVDLARNAHSDIDYITFLFVCLIEFWNCLYCKNHVTSFGLFPIKALLWNIFSSWNIVCVFWFIFFSCTEFLMLEMPIWRSWCQYTLSLCLFIKILEWFALQGFCDILRNVSYYKFYLLNTFHLGVFIYFSGIVEYLNFLNFVGFFLYSYY